MVWLKSNINSGNLLNKDVHHRQKGWTVGLECAFEFFTLSSGELFYPIKK
jgi:hypothetical protein